MQVQGYAYAGTWKPRNGYNHTAEVSVYIRNGEQGRGLGAKLYAAIMDQLKSMEMHTVIAVLTIPNPASVQFHQKLGFTQVGRLIEVGYKFGKWLDVAYFQKML